MTPEVEPREEADPGRNGRSAADPEIHTDVDPDERLQFGTYNDVAKYDQLPEAVYIEPPEHQEGLLNAIRVLRHHAKRKRAAEKGYIKWYLIGANWPRPKWVKPEQKGGGVRELEHDGHRYLFPKQEMMPDDLTGAWAICHRKGEADPINVRHREPGEGPPLPGDMVEESFTARVTTSSPGGWLSNMGAQEIFRWGILVMIGLVVTWYLLNGGIA